MMSSYDEHPFDWVDGSHVEATYPRLFTTFLDSLPVDSKICEIGCGPGRNLRGIKSRLLHAIGVDLSWVSALRARAMCPTAKANALCLPFRDGTFDAVIIDGVAHHTPDPECAIREAVRITRACGRIYVAIYKRGTLYSFLYATAGATLRAINRLPGGRAVNECAARYVYRPAHYYRRRTWRTVEAIRNLYWDYFLTPIASFHSQEEVTRWISESGARIEEIDDFPDGNCRLFITSRISVSRE